LPRAHPPRRFGGVYAALELVRDGRAGDARAGPQRRGGGVV